MKFGRMKSHRRNRLLIIVFIVCAAAGATTFTLFALNENINLFYSPEQIVRGEAPLGKTIRAGGMVQDGSVIRAEEGLGVSFVVSDLKSAQVTIEFEGILPDMFREGQGIIALCQVTDKSLFVEEEVLAKHDENYMPPEVADALKNEHQSSAETYNKANYN